MTTTILAEPKATQQDDHPLSDILEGGSYRLQGEHATRDGLPQLSDSNYVQPGLERQVPQEQQAQRTFSSLPSTTLGKSRRFFLTSLIIGSNLVQMISNMVGIGGGLELGRILGAGIGPSHSNWIAASYPLTQGTFVLVSGRLGAVYGHKNMLTLGGFIFSVCSVINGFCDTFVSFNIVRAITGVGGALIMPNAVAMIGIALPPGRMRNLCMGLFAASAPVGGWLGTMLCGGMMKVASWHWNFWFLAILGAVIFGALHYCSPEEVPVDRGGKIDWVGLALGTSSLIIFNFVWNQAPSVGWSTPYEIALLIVSVTLWVIFLIWERYYAAAPIMPLDVFKAPSFLPLILVVLLSYMSFGTGLWYMVAWQQLLRSWSVLSFAIGLTPFAIGAGLAASLAAWLIPRMAAQWILAIGALSTLLGDLILATMPVQQTYWAQMFVANIVMSLCPDFVYAAAQIIASNSVNRKQQGIAGSLIGTLNLYGNALGLGFAGTIETQVSGLGSEPVKGYRAALFFGVGLAAVALVCDLLFVRVEKDDREGWDDTADEDAVEGVVGVTGIERGLELHPTLTRV
ncbi:hypothetical protein FDECE_2832 [Fusarium decemcellulare]|nr:hypothetical protein FDECE_2832 [Fusarium decemcellulare]